jgi:hypothetical protein
MLSWIRRLYIGGKAIDLRHPFDEELDCLVRSNHALVWNSIARIEAEPEERDPDYANELRRAANNQALVTLITRLHHWVCLLIEEFIKKKSVREKGLVSNMNFLNSRTGPGPVPVDFFQELVTVRDSIIHADSQTSWTFKDEMRQVAEKYSNAETGEVEFTRSDLEEAIDKAVKQVRWYHDRLEALETTERR